MKKYLILLIVILTTIGSLYVYMTQRPKSVEEYLPQASIIQTAKINLYLNTPPQGEVFEYELPSSAAFAMLRNVLFNMLLVFDS